MPHANSPQNYQFAHVHTIAAATNWLSVLLIVGCSLCGVGPCWGQGVPPVSLDLLQKRSAAQEPQTGITRRREYDRSATAKMTELPDPERSVDLVLLEQRAVKDAVNYVADSVVKLETLGGVGSTSSQSSAICVARSGLFLTAAYNLRDWPSSIFIRATARALNGGAGAAVRTRRFVAEVVATDHGRHLVLLKATPTADFQFSPIQLADVSKARVGQTVIAVGKLYDEQRPNLSVGIISALGRIWNRAIQTDAKVSRANYGGPLIDLAGMTIGILCPLLPDDDDVEAGDDWYDSGIGFAVPLTDYQSTIDQLAQGNDVYRGLLGVSIEGKDRFAEDAVIAYCYPRSPATQARLRRGDRIVEINGTKVKTHAQMKHVMGPLLADEEVEIVVERAGAALTCKATLARKIEPYVELALGVVPSRRGNEQALTIGHVLADSPAEEANLHVGDKIIEIDGKPLSSWSELGAALLRCKTGQAIELGVRPMATANRSAQNGQALARVSVTPAPMSAAPPQGLPDMVRLSAEKAKAEVVEITTAESSNLCYAIVPENDFGKVGAPGLFVWVAQPGASDSAATLAAVAEICQRNNMLLLVPQSLNEKSWTPGECGFIVKAIQRLAKKVAFDPSRVAIGGEKTAGTMACLTAFNNRETFRGLVMFDAMFPAQIPRVETAPEQRLLIYLSTSPAFAMTEKLDKIERALEKKKFPVHRTQGAADRLIDRLPEVSDWIRTLDRR